MYIFVLDIYWQQLGNICQLNLYIGIGHILSTIGEYMSIGGVSAPFHFPQPCGLRPKGAQTSSNGHIYPITINRFNFNIFPNV